MVKTPSSFRGRTRELDRRLAGVLSEFDVLLQVSSLFSPFAGEFPKPVALFLDYTTKLAELNYPPWFGLSRSQGDEWYRLETDLYRRSGLICAASKNTADSLTSHYGVDPAKVIVVGEGVEQVHEPGDNDYHQSTILFVGRDFERKGGPTLLAAFAEVRRRIPGARLIIVGPATRASAQSVVWLGEVSDRRALDEIYSRSSVFCMPSVCEPFGLASIEAMAHGLPVVGSTVDAMPEIVEEGATGLLVRPGDVAGLADRLTRLLSSPALCAEMGAQGKARVRQAFLWDRVVSTVEHGLRRLYEGEGSTA